MLDADRAALEALPFTAAVELRIGDAYALLDRLMRLRDAVQAALPESKDW